MIKFSKMHGLGNDFIVIDGINQSIDPSILPISKLADRHLGIGFDQLLLIENSNNADVACRIFNADGSSAEQCGNGLRCVARFIKDNKLINKNSLRIETLGGIFQAVFCDNDLIQVEMGVPSFESLLTPVQIRDTTFSVSILSMGNPHAVIRVNSLNNYPVKEMGVEIASHSIFPQGTNVGFMEIINPRHIRLRTFERGVGETLACGSNACASVVAGILAHFLESKVKVELPLGELWIEWPGTGKEVIMTGPAKNVFDGFIDFSN